MKNGDKYVRPFSMSFWWRPNSDADWTVFDAGIRQLGLNLGDLSP